MVLEMLRPLCLFLILFAFHSCDVIFYNPFRNNTFISHGSIVATPVLSPVGGTYNSDQSITITCATNGATVYYTTDGSDPDEGSSQYTVPVSVAGQGADTTIKAIAVKNDMLDSATASEEYIISYYLAGWSNSLNITINADTLGLGNDVSNFPLLIRLDSTNFPDIVTKTKSGGADIRFVKQDGINLYYEIEEWIDNTSGNVWVLLDNVANNSATTIIMYYNNPVALDESNSETVFNTTNGFLGVWHLSEDPSGLIFDSTSNSNDGFSNGGMDSSDLIAAPVGGGLDFLGGTSGQYLDMGNDASLNITDTLSVSMWINVDVDQPASEWPTIAGKGNENSNGWRIYQNENGHSLEFSYADAGVGSPHYGILRTSTFPLDTWHYLAISFDGTVPIAKMYLDGDEVDSSLDVEEIMGNSENLFVADEVGNGKFDGMLDEVRFSSVPRSADWIKLSYENQRTGSTVVSVGP